MKICSRPDEIAGEGDYTLKMDLSELALIGSLLQITRLGTGTEFSKAALKLLNTFDELFPADFSHESLLAVSPKFSRTNYGESVTVEVFTYDEITIEV